MIIWLLLWWVVESSWLDSKKEIQASVPRYDSFEGILRDLETSLFVSAEELREDVLRIGGVQEVVPFLRLPTGQKGFGFGNGSLGNFRTISLSIVLRGHLLDLPTDAYTDLYNLDLKRVSFASRGSSDVIAIGGSDGERGYTVFLVIEDGKYIGRKVRTL